MPGREPVLLDAMHKEETQGQYRLFFRLPPPPQTTNAEVIWRHHRLSELTLPVIQRGEFVEKLALQNATLAVRLGNGNQTVACQTFVSSQCCGVFASAVLSSPTSLAPLVDLGFARRVATGKREGQQDDSRLLIQFSAKREARARDGLPAQLAETARHRMLPYGRSANRSSQPSSIKAISKTQFAGRCAFRRRGWWCRCRRCRLVRQLAVTRRLHASARVFWSAAANLVWRDLQHGCSSDSERRPANSSANGARSAGHRRPDASWSRDARSS